MGTRFAYVSCIVSKCTITLQRCSGSCVAISPRELQPLRPQASSTAIASDQPGESIVSFPTYRSVLIRKRRRQVRRLFAKRAEPSVCQILSSHSFNHRKATSLFCNAVDPGGSAGSEVCVAIASNVHPCQAPPGQRQHSSLRKVMQSGMTMHEEAEYGANQDSLRNQLLSKPK